jgi:hypothetical protein
MTFCIRQTRFGITNCERRTPTATTTSTTTYYDVFTTHQSQALLQNFFSFDFWEIRMTQNKDSGLNGTERRAKIGQTQHFGFETLSLFTFSFSFSLYIPNSFGGLSFIIAAEGLGLAFSLEYGICRLEKWGMETGVSGREWGIGSIIGQR